MWPTGLDRSLDMRRAFRTLAIATTASTVLLIAWGGVVRATGSGDGCPDWPRCFGSWIPRIDYHTLIEYFHRLLALVSAPRLQTATVRHIEVLVLRPQVLGVFDAKAPVARAFDVFTSGLSRWWPLDHGVGKKPIAGNKL